MAVSAPVKVGDVLADKFRVDKIVGAGGMGVVVEATHLVLHQRVALKFLNEQATHVPGVVARFEREARAAASLRSAHAVRIMDVGVMEDAQPYIVMELLDGQDLASVIRGGERLGVETAISYLRQACDAVGEAHRGGIVHRDLKPGNLFVTTDTRGQPLVKVLDFGISKVAGEDLALTETSQLLGSPLYMSPEQLRASRDVDARADVWSLGVILYEMLAGKVPFTADSMMELLFKIVESTPEPLSSFRDDIPPYVIRAVEGCLIKEREQRIGSIDELLAMLEPDAPPRELPASAPASAPRSGRTKEPELDARAVAATVHEGRTPSDGSASEPGALELSASTNGGVARPAPPGSDPAAGLSEKDASPPSGRADTTQSSAPPTSAFARWRWQVAGVIALATVGGALVTLQRRTTLEAPAGPLASASASASNAAPVSTSPEAAKAYEEGAAALRACDWPRANALFKRALAADRECTAAALHILLMARYLRKEQDSERHVEIYRALDARRSRLSARDVTVLEALQPSIMRESPDIALTRARLVDASQAFPGDATIAFFAAVASENDPAATLSLTDRVLAIDPGYLDAMQLRARALLLLGRTEEGRKQLETCVAANPAAQCTGDLMLLLMAEGKCAPAEAVGKSYVRRSAGTDEAYEYYALALAGNDADRATVAEAIHQSAAKGAPELAPLFEPLMLANLAVLRGELASAERQSLALMKLVDQRPDAVWHEQATFLRAELLRERGDGAELKALASDFFARRRVWNRSGSPDWATPALLAALDETDAMPHAEVVRLADAWLADSKGARAPRWVVAAFGSRTARGADEAKAWLERGGPIEPISPSRTAVSGRGYYGRATLVAGDAAGASKILTDASRTCSGLHDPFAVVRAQLALGQAREALSDTGGACAAYGDVLKRWGRETPLGTTAKAAKARHVALKCGEPGAPPKLAPKATPASIPRAAPDCNPPIYYDPVTGQKKVKPGC
jgi:eukaryotic-like serine/threonine-protein kinase